MTGGFLFFHALPGEPAARRPAGRLFYWKKPEKAQITRERIRLYKGKKNMRSILLTGLLLLIAASGFTQNTDSLKFYLNQGRDQFKKRHYEQAYESLQKVLGYDPTSYEAIKMLAVSDRKSVV